MRNEKGETMTTRDLLIDWNSHVCSDTQIKSLVINYVANSVDFDDLRKRATDVTDAINTAFWVRMHSLPKNPPKK